MEFITYIIYCITSVFTTAYAGETGASWINLLVGMLSLFILVGIFGLITLIICHVRKKKQKAAGKDDTEIEEQQELKLFKSLPAKQKREGKDFIK